MSIPSSPSSNESLSLATPRLSRSYLPLLSEDESSEPSDDLREMFEGLLAATEGVLR